MSKTTWSNGQTTQDPHVINFIPLSITFQSPDWGFPPSSPISFLRIERSKAQHWSNSWTARGSRLNVLGSDRQEPPEAAGGKNLPAWLEQENSWGKATFCCGLASALQWPQKQHCSWADMSCGQWNGSRAGSGSSAGSVLCSTERDPCR